MPPRKDPYASRTHRRIDMILLAVTILILFLILRASAHGQTLSGISSHRGGRHLGGSNIDRNRGAGGHKAKPTPTPSPAPTQPPPGADGPKTFSTTATSWTTSGNWTPSGVPATTDNVLITGGTSTMTITGVAGGLNFEVQDISFSDTSNRPLENGSSVAGRPSTLILNGGRGTGTPLISVSDAGDFTIRNGTTNTLTLQLNTSGAFDIGSTGNLIISSNITEGSAGTSLTIQGSGTGHVTLSGTNSFSGGLFLNGSELQVSSDASLGASGGSITIQGGALTATTGFTISSSRDIFLTSSGSINVAKAQTLIYSGIFKDLPSNTGALTIGNLSGDTGTFQIGGVSTYTGATTITRGTLQLIVGNDRLPTGTDLTLSSTNTSAKLDLNGFNQTILSLSGGSATAGLVSLGSGTLTINTGASTNATYAGIISGTGAVVVSGSGTEIFTRAQTYTGTTTVNGGKLFINTATGSLAAGSAVTVNNGGTLGGAGGTINGSISVASGGILEGGTGSTGQTLNLTGAVTMSGGSIIELALGSSFSHSTLAVSGGGTMSFATGTGASSQMFTFIDTGGVTTGTYQDIITGVADPGATISNWTITNAGYIGSFVWDGANIDLTLIAVPEPSTWIAGALAVIGVALTQRRRIVRLLARA